MNLNQIIFLILRRMRAPLLMVIISYAIALIGFVLITGIDDQGRPYHLSFFDAFYILSYTATTIGFGEIPYAFTGHQRMWMTFSIYFTVIAWFYAIGAIIGLFQEASLQQAIKTARFQRDVCNLMEPFYLICGYGETGSELVRALDKNELRVVVLEINPERINELGMNEYQFYVPHLCADAKMSEVLLYAGIKNPMCKGVAALTDDDHANLAISVAVKLIKPELPVLARVENDVVAANMASFGTDHIINPYKIFGEHLAMRLNALGTYLLHEWLTRAPGDAIEPPAAIPKGKWIACGFGRFGKSVVNSLQKGVADVTIIEADPKGTQCEHCIVGSGVESHILQQAGVEQAVGIVAGTDNDINNLSIVMTAQEVNPELFVIIRKNKRHNDPLFQHFNADITMQPSDVIAHTCLSYMVSPMLAEFLATARHQTNAWANAVIAQLVSKLGEQVPDTWDITIGNEMAFAVCALMQQGLQPSLKHLVMSPSGKRHEMPVVPLMLVRGEQKSMLPELSTPLQIGDKILCCGMDQAKSIQRYVMHDIKTLHYIVTGTEMPETWIGRWLKSKN
ncbi:MAG TPA: NAD-binding protein [Methylophilus sp.]|uniref:potassium channel family protein n=1 Tax=Methylophilus sp. TaxID=29541 RepID=UPI002B612E44|nr:NAD-binding protein [Methylophilus sp.]HSH86936.1 NAD-binding protein [Methylophilus sp.]